MDEDKRKDYVATIAFVVSIVKDVAIVLIEIYKLLAS